MKTKGAARTSKKQDRRNTEPAGLVRRALWLSLALLCLITIIGIPLALLMYERAAAVTTLRRM